jgi:carboxymethylenebutenolidase
MRLESKDYLAVSTAIALTKNRWEFPLEISSGMVEFSNRSAGRKAAGFLARPKKGGTYPAVIVIHEIWGLVDHMKDVATRFAREGYVGLAVDLFEGKIVTKLEDGRKFREQFTEEKIVGDLNGAFDYLKNLSYSNPKGIGSIGFCMGGGLSLLLACQNQELAAAVVFYGRNPSPIDRVKTIQCPILCNYAGADMAITESDINLLKQTLTKYKKTFDIKTYPEAPHAFFNDTRESYRPEAAKDAWARTLRFFNKYLKA